MTRRIDAVGHFGLLFLLLGGHLAASEVPGLVDASLVVTPSQVVASGLQKTQGTAVIRVTTDTDYLGSVTLQAEDPLVLWDKLPRVDRCGSSDLYRTWPYRCTAPHPNRNVACRFDGIISRCTGSGGTPPPFKADIVHIDLDVDSDNDSDPLTMQKRHHTGDPEAEDAVEFPSEPELPGLVLITNRGFEEDGYGNGSAPLEDRRKDGIVDKDQDLSQGQLAIKGRKPGYADLTYPEQLYRIYRQDGLQWIWWRSGERLRCEAAVTIPLLLEGIDPGLGTTFATFTPDDLSRGGQPAIDKQRITVVDVVLQVDRDRDGIAPLGEKATDLTSTSHPLRFWTNTDSDGSAEDNEPTSADYANDAWRMRGSGRQPQDTYRLRDLEDLNRMRLVVRGIDDHLKAKRMSVALRWVEDDGLRLKGYWNEDQDCLLNHLKNQADGERFCRNARLLAEAVGSNQAEIPVGQRSLVPGSGGYHSPWLWHAMGEARNPASSGRVHRGRLGVVVRWGTGRSARPIAWYRHLHLALSDARRWYEHDTCGDTVTNKFDGRPHAPRPPADGDFRYTSGESGLWVQDADQYDNPALKASKDKVLAFIHGYRMRPWERRAFAETMLKRLYWQDFGGRIVFLSWPTEYVSVPIGQILSPGNYDRSEVISRLTGTLLGGWLTDLGTRADTKDVILSCHSQGNVVLSSAIRALGNSLVAGSYLSLQSADVASAYDPTVGDITKSDSPGFLLGAIQSTQSPSTITNALAPDLYRFDNPLEGREIPSGGLNAKEPRLTSPTHGEPYALTMRTAFTRRINLRNDIDFATAAVFFTNAYYRATGQGNTGYEYRRLAVDGTDAFLDDWRGRTDTTNWPSWLGGTLRPIWRSMQWQPDAPGNDLQVTQRALILSMITPPRSRLVGAEASGTRACFNEQMDGRELGMTNDGLHHSYQFNLTIQKTWNVWSTIRGKL